MIIDLSTSTTRAFAKQISTDSLGDHSYIIVVGDSAVAIDIQRDLERFETVLEGIDAHLEAVFETHIHNDYVSGGLRLAQAHGAKYVLPADTGATFGHVPLADGQVIGVGDWIIRAMHTPGHTHHHTSYVLESPEGPVAIFSGGSMLVGAVGRSDLLGPDHTAQLLQDQYTSVRRIADELPDPSVVAPTHGTGSFCSASDVTDTTSTIEQEKLQNPALLAPSVEAFATSQVLGYKQYPVYYKHMGPSNLVSIGAPPTGDLLMIVSIDDVRGVPIVDVRPFEDYAAGHLPGSLSIPASTDDAVYMGWTLAWNTPIVLVGPKETVADVRVRLQRIGWDNVVGHIDPRHLSAMVEGPLTVTKVVTFSELGTEPSSILDVRDRVEHETGVIPGATLAHLADVARDPNAYATTEIFIHCQSGYRAGIAAGFFEAAGLTVTVIHDDLAHYEGVLASPS